MSQVQEFSETPAHEPVPHQSKTVKLSKTKPRLLLVEDQDVNQILIQAMTRRLGYESEMAADGTEAVKATRMSVLRLMPGLMPM